MKTILKRLLVVFLIMTFVSASVLILGACTSPKNEAFSGESKATEAPEETDPSEPAVEADSSNYPRCRIVTFGGGSWGVIPGLTYDYSESIHMEADESKIGQKKSVSFAGKEYNLIYKETIDYVVNDFTVDSYEIVSDDPGFEQSKTSAKLLSDGTLVSIWIHDGAIAQITFDKDMGHEEIAASVADALKAEIDVGAFEHVDVVDPDPEKLENNYSITWYNETSGLTHRDYIWVKMDPDGRICSVWMTNRAIHNLEDTSELKLDDYIPAIEAKLHDMYGDYTSYELKSSSLTVVEGSPCIYCEGVVELVYQGKDEKDIFDFAVIPEN